MAERPGRNESVAAGGLTRHNTGFLLAKASQHWNELLRDRFTAAGYADVRPAYGALLVPLYEQDGLRQGELARRARLSKQSNRLVWSNAEPTPAMPVPPGCF